MFAAPFKVLIMNQGVECIQLQVRVSRGNQLAGLEGANNDSVFIGKV